MSCNKTYFTSRRKAQEKLGSIRSTGQRRQHTPRRAYQCPYCGCWHLTSEYKRSE